MERVPGTRCATSLAPTDPFRCCVIPGLAPGVSHVTSYYDASPDARPVRGSSSGRTYVNTNGPIA